MIYQLKKGYNFRTRLEIVLAKCLDALVSLFTFSYYSSDFNYRAIMRNVKRNIRERKLLNVHPEPEQKP